jgi:hypothetical protein
VNQIFKKPNFFITLSIACAVAILSSHAASQMAFGVLGRTPEDPGWLYTITLFLAFAVSAITVPIGMLSAKQSLRSKLAISISISTSVVWFGCYYVGIIADGKSPRIAIIFAITILLLITFSSFYLSTRFVMIAAIVMGTVAAYGLAFLCSVAAFAFLSTNDFLWGSIWWSFCLGAIALSIFSLNLLRKEIANYR